MEDLLELNRKTLFSKLDQICKIADCYLAADLIDLLSNQPVRDKRLINDYSRDEVKTYMVKRPVGFRTMRFLTTAGILRYLSEGKIYDLQNACLYFQVKPKDPTDDLKKQLSKFDKNHVKTSLILKWLFDKRKSNKQLTEYTDFRTVYETYSNDKTANQEKLKMLNL